LLGSGGFVWFTTKQQLLPAFLLGTLFYQIHDPLKVITRINLIGVDFYERHWTGRGWSAITHLILSFWHREQLPYEK